MKNLKTFLLSLLLLSTGASGSLLVGSTENVEPDVVPSQTLFTSDVPLWGDQQDVVLGDVPIDFEGWQMVRLFASHINFNNINIAFNVSPASDVVYINPTFEDPNTNRPAFLSGRWSDTGNDGVIAVPDTLLGPGNYQDVTAHYFINESVTSIAVAGTTAADWTKKLGHYPGAFLVEPGATISAVYPEIYTVISDISQPYTGQIPAQDELYIDSTPPGSYGAADRTAAGGSQCAIWSDFATEVNSASNGDEVELPAGTYNDCGEIVFTKSATVASPVRARPPSPGGAVISGTSRIRWSSTTDAIILEGMHFLNVEAASSFGHLLDLDPGAKFNVIRNNWFQNIDTPGANRMFVFFDEGDYNRFHNNGVDNHEDAIQTYRLKNTIFSRGDHNIMQNRFSAPCTTPCSNQPQDTQHGNSGEHGVDLWALWDNNHHKDVRPEDEGETIGVKSDYVAVVNNILENADGIISFRVAEHWASFGNVFVNTGSHSGHIYAIAIGGGNDTSEGLGAVNYINGHNYPNGWHRYLRLPQSQWGDYSPDSAGYYIADKLLLVGDIVRNGAQPIVNGTTRSGTGPSYKHPINVKVIGLGAVTSSACANVEGWWNPTTYGYTWSDTYLDCGSSGFGTTPSGITLGSPILVDRGDGVYIPNQTTSPIDYGENRHFPFWLIDDDPVAEIGPTWSP